MELLFYSNKRLYYFQVFFEFKIFLYFLVTDTKLSDRISINKVPLNNIEFH